MDIMGTGVMKGQMKMQSLLEFCLFTTPQIEPIIFVPASKHLHCLFATFVICDSKQPMEALGSKFNCGTTIARH